MGSVKTGVILKDVSLEVHGGEVLAILGSKGSGKRALLEVISRRAQGPTRGQILLNGAPMSLRLFQQNCGYVTHKCDLLPGLTVSRYVKRSRMKQVMADLALTQVANRAVGDLTQIVLLLDEPTWDLDPLNTYLVISILSNHARKYSRAVILTMEKPRSDVFPFLDRVAYLCLGDVVYTGGTRLMLDYFRSIGFPCPELENPLMYYLCLSTVDRRSRERFIESNHQIAALVEKFKLEGGPFRRKTSTVTPGGVQMLDSTGEPIPVHNMGVHTVGSTTPSIANAKVPLSAFGRPNSFTVAFTLYMLTEMNGTTEWLLFGAVQLACYLLAQQQTIAIMLVVRSSFTAAVISIYITIIYLMLGSGSLRAFSSLSEWLLHLTYATQTRYAGAFLNQQMFGNDGWTNLNLLPRDEKTNCTFTVQDPPSFTCRFASGRAYLIERYSRENGGDSLQDMLDMEINLGISFAFPVGLAIFNSLLYLVPLPAFIKGKFRE
ncbi:hypothetical protein C0J52_23893 [Blattella germanica]|nr:hypothetical protein C0J52_23893 [Blattella germanica]